MHNIEKTINHIGTKIKYYRVLNKISLTKFAEEANISKSTLFGLEEGKSNPTISTLINISNTLNINLNELIGTNSSEADNANISLISAPENDEYRVYKLVLMPNEIFIFNKYTHKMSVEILEGSIKLIDSSVSLYCGDSITIGFNRRFKAFSKGSIILLKVYNVKDSYHIKEDFYSESSSKDLIGNVAKQCYSKLINRVIFRKTKPIEQFSTPKYINYIEILKNNGESHYYLFRKYLGLMGGLNKTLLQLINKYDSNYEKFKTFIDLSAKNHILKKEDCSLISTSPAQDCKDIIIKSANVKYNNLIILENIEDLTSINNKEKKYYILLDDYASNNSNLNILTLTIKLYRVFENLYILEEKGLKSIELKLYNIFLASIPKALYFAYNGYLELSISYLNKILKDVKSYDFSETDTKLITKYKWIIKELKSIEDAYENKIYLNSVCTIEAIAKDFNLTIELKELVSPVIEECGLYCYILKS